MFLLFFSSEENCQQHKVCCLNDYIVKSNSPKPTYVQVPNNNENSRSCGVGMSNSQYNDEIGTRIVASGAFI